MGVGLGIGQHPKGFINLLLLVLCLGIICGAQAGGLRGMVELLWLLAGVSIAVGAVLLARGSRLTLLPVMLAVFLLGWGCCYSAAVPGAHDIAAFEGRQVKLEGILDGNPRVTADEQGNLRLRYVLVPQKLLTADVEKPVTGSLLVYANESSLDIELAKSLADANGEADWASVPETQLGRSGDRMVCSGTVQSFHDYGNPGRMNTAMAYMAQGITGQMAADKYSLRLIPEEADWLPRLSGEVRSRYRAYMEQAMSREDGAAVFAMLFGGYQGIRPELLEAFTTVGLVHILSVSGSHITLMAGLAGALGRLLHLPASITGALAALTIVFYGILAGAVPPVIRSAVMGLLTVLALTMGRDKDAQHILGLAALGMLLHSPLLLYDISFQLSFGAAAGLLYIAPPLRQLLRRKLPVFAADSLAVTIGAQLSVLPVIIWYFNAVSFSSLAANLIIAPAAEGIIAAGLLAGLLASLLPWLGHLIFVAAGVAMGLVYELSRLLAALPGSKIYVPSLSWWSCALYYAVLLFCLLPPEVRHRVSKTLPAYAGFLHRLRQDRGLAGAGAAAGILIVFVLVRQAFLVPQELQVHFIDVGQGDAALVITPHGHAFMVDTGGVRQRGYDIGKMVDVPYLLHYGIQRLDYIFLTHAHDDHAAGVRGIIGRLPVGAIMIGHEGAGEYLKVFGTGENKKLAKLLLPLQENTVMELDGVKIEVLYSPSVSRLGEGNAAGGGNEYSNLLRVSYGRASFLFTGDLAAEQEAELLSRGVALRSTVLKVGHHGSRSSSSEAFLQAAAPKWAVISCGYHNSFGHPHQEVLARLRQHTGAQILRTDEQGAICFFTDGKNIRVEHYKD